MTRIMYQDCYKTVYRMFAGGPKIIVTPLSCSITCLVNATSKYLHGLIKINNCNFIRIQQSSRTRGNGMKQLYKEQRSIDARHQFYPNRIVDRPI